MHLKQIKSNIKELEKHGRAVAGPSGGVRPGADDNFIANYIEVKGYSMFDDKSAKRRDNGYDQWFHREFEELLT